MKTSEYEIYFTNGDVRRVCAVNYEDAKILAMAKQIEDGRDRSISLSFSYNQAEWVRQQEQNND
jgi:hypothetical protein